MPLISIIIPIYNVEKYIAKAIESCINQTYKDIEIVCINDGSTDNSSNILNEYAQKDSRIKVIDKINEGVSVARNTGIEASQGEYLLFLDADDWYCDNQVIEKVYSKIQSDKFDVLYFNILSYYKTMIRKKNAILPYQKCKNEYLVYSNDSLRSCCRKEFLMIHNIKFPPSIKISEDHIFNIQILYNNPKISLSDEYLYCYLAEREDSATRSWVDLLNNQYQSYVYMKNTDFYKGLEKQKQLYITDIWAYYMFSSWAGLQEKKYQKEYDKVINRFLLSYKYFEDFKYKNMYGYKLLKLKQFYKLLIKIRNVIYKIRYRKVDNNV